MVLFFNTPMQRPMALGFWDSLSRTEHPNFINSPELEQICGIFSWKGYHLTCCKFWGLGGAYSHPNPSNIQPLEYNISPRKKILKSPHGKYVANIKHFRVNKFFFISLRKKTAISQCNSSLLSVRAFDHMHMRSNWIIKLFLPNLQEFTHGLYS